MGSNLNKPLFKHFLDWQLTTSCWNDGDFCGQVWYQSGPKKIVNELIFLFSIPKFLVKRWIFAYFLLKLMREKLQNLASGANINQDLFVISHKPAKINAFSLNCKSLSLGLKKNTNHIKWAMIHTSCRSDSSNFSLV